jgi:dolichyl-phosphate-mannose--protein O-mannosyl transferase
MNRNLKHLFLLLFAGLILRLLLSPFGTLELDMNTFIAWSRSLVQNGPQNFYNSWSDYLPGYAYILWLLGSVNQFISSTVLYKFPAIIADLITGLLIYKIVREIKSPKIALLATAIYIFNPAILANSALWGQVDSITAMFALSSVYFASKKPMLSAILLSVGTMVKPQAALALIPVLFIAGREKWKLTKLIKYALVGLAVFILGFLPFYSGGGLVDFVVARLNQTLNQYPYTSVNAFNLWGLTGFWQPDTWQNVIGWLLTILLSVFFAIKLLKIKSGEYLLLAWVLLIGFLFMTRLHERHMLPVLAPLAVGVGLYPSLIFTYLILSFTYVLNLRFAYVWITEDFKNIFTSIEINFLIFLNLLASLYFAAVLWTKKELKVVVPKYKKTEIKDSVGPKLGKKLLMVIIIFAFTARVFWLWEPSTHYFDEVYHAFTAQVMLKGDPKAWEWWNPNPEGFAYEWTHPPLAKEAMVIGMTIFGDNAYGYRILQAIFGTFSVLLIYLISKKLFNSRDVGLIAAFVFALDGLTLTMSRIGMNDTYLITFMLLCFYLFLKDKYLFASIALGLALASKWSIIWFLPVLVVEHFALNKKLTIKYLWFLVIPPLVYLASYIPFFTSGHTVENFIELQKQMWWYHTRLVAQHSYSSSWLSWPFNLRPVWAYVDRSMPGYVANIYLMGNPLVFWGGVVGFVVGVVYAALERNKTLGLVIFAYLAMFVTWAASPRIMFFYHYLPAFAFLTIILGYVLKRNPRVVKPFFVIAIILFIYFYPHWSGIQVPIWLDNTYYWLGSWK